MTSIPIRRMHLRWKSKIAKKEMLMSKIFINPFSYLLKDESICFFSWLQIISIHFGICYGQNYILFSQPLTKNTLLELDRRILAGLLNWFLILYTAVICLVNEASLVHSPGKAIISLTHPTYSSCSLVHKSAQPNRTSVPVTNFFAASKWSFIPPD